MSGLRRPLRRAPAIPDSAAPLVVAAVVVAAAVTATGCGPPAPVPALPVPAAEAGHLRMVALLEDIRRRAPDEHLYVGDAKVREWHAELAALGPDAPASARWQLLAMTGERLSLLGREREGVALLEQAYALLPAAGAQVPREHRAQCVLSLGASWLRIGETENCCALNSPESCILPLAGPALHARPEGSRKAMKYVLEALELAEPGSDAHLQAIWLLNFAAMTLGEFPQAVPEELRIPASWFESDEEFPKFPNVAGRAGLDTFSLLGSVAIDDFDDDGDLDLFVSDWNVDAPLRLFRNEGDGTFTDRAREANLTGIFGGINLVQADYDNDGDTDLLVLRGAWLARGGRYPKSLLRNDGGLRFTDVTFDAGLGEVQLPTQTAAFADYDNDGDLDLYVGHESTPMLEAPSQFLRNEGDGTFTDRTAAAGVANLRMAKGVSWGDYDGDSFPDLYVSNLSGANRLYRNRGDGTFADLAPALGLTAPHLSFATWFWDFDEDGALDVLALAYPLSSADLCAAALGIPRDTETHKLYRGDGTGGFAEVGRAMGLVEPSLPMGANYGDLDNDGWLDVYLGTGRPASRDLMPNVMYRNRAGRGFADVTLAGGFGHLQKGHGIAFADLDDDGDQDVFEEIGGAFLGDRFRDVLFENPGFGRSWLSVRLRGVRSNRSAIGARIRATFTEGGVRRSIHRWVNSGGSFGANPLRQHLGLGEAKVVESLEIHWPTTGTTQTFRDVAVGRHLTITEGEDRLVERLPKPVRIGGGPR